MSARRRNRGRRLTPFHHKQSLPHTPVFPTPFEVDSVAKKLREDEEDERGDGGVCERGSGARR